MIFLTALLLPLVLFPILAIFFFDAIVKDRRREDVRKDLGTHGVLTSESSGNRAPPDGEASTQAVIVERSFERQFENQYSIRHFLLPASLLTFLYSVGASIAGAFLSSLGDDASNWPYGAEFIRRDAPPLLVALMSVYLFNMYHTLRRLYLTDLNAHVFWYCLYRVGLVTALTIVVAFGGMTPAMGTVGGGAGYLAFFGIGFLATDFLYMVIVTAQKVFNLREREPEMLLTLIRGLNIWNEYRLAEEGIENVEQLATSDVVDLAIRTHYPLMTLLDWIDQAILISNFGNVVQCRLLREKALINSAIDLAWMSPLSSAGDPNPYATADKIANVLDLDPQFVREKMNALFQDRNVRFLWQLWQARGVIAPRAPRGNGGSGSGSGSGAR